MPEILKALDGFTFGCDPEVFLLDAHGQLASPIDIIPGTKDDPYPVPGGAIQRDGMAAEFNIDPAETFEEFSGNIDKVLDSMKKILPPGWSFKAESSVMFDTSVWSATPASARALGCSPDFNAWTGEINPPPNGKLKPRVWSGGGHVHIGWTQDARLDDEIHIHNCRDLVRQLDWFVGAWGASFDTDNTRRSLYGKAGACRYKSYGVEYRVLSNFWVLRKERRLSMWNRIQTAINEMRHTFLPTSADKLYPNATELLKETINSSSRSVALEKYFRYPIREVRA